MILKTGSLIKKYKSRTVVKGVSVEVSQGEIVGLDWQKNNAITKLNRMNVFPCFYNYMLHALIMKGLNNAEDRVDNIIKFIL